MNKRLVKLLEEFMKTGHGKWEFSFPGVVKVTHLEKHTDGEYSTITGEFIHGANILEMEVIQ